MIGERSSQMVTFPDFNVGQIEQDVKAAELIRFLTVKKRANNLEEKPIFVED